jgi:hypothetical protein
MLHYSPNELRGLTLDYLRQHVDVERECRAAVANWRFADARMVGPERLCDQVQLVFDPMRDWDRAKQGKWLGSEHDTAFPYGHGFDRQERLRVLTYGKSIRLWSYLEACIDELWFNADEQMAELKRFLLSSDGTRVHAYYTMREFDTEKCCTEELFDWAANRIASSQRRAWTWEDDVPTEWEFNDKYDYSYDRRGRLVRCVCTTTRCGKPWMTRAVYSRHPIRGICDRAMNSLRYWTVENLRRRSWTSD